MAFEFNVGMVSRGTNVVAFTFGIGYNTSGISTSVGGTVNECYGHKPSNSNLSAICAQMTVGDIYDCYIGGIIDDSHKLGFSMYKSANFSTNVACLVFKDFDTGCSFALPVDNSGTADIYLALPYIGTDLNYADYTVTSMSDLKILLGQFRIRYQLKTHDLWKYGMCNYNTAFLLGMYYDSSQRKRLITDYNNTGNYSALKGYYHNLFPYWNWHTFMTGKRYHGVQYLETLNGEKIYCGITISSIELDHMLKDYTTPYYPESDTIGRPCVSYDYQSGTDLRRLLPTTGSSITLKNGSLLKCTHKADGGRHYYYYEIVNSTEQPEVYITAAFNTRRQSGDLVSSNFTGSFDSDLTYDLVQNYVGNYHFQARLNAVNLWSTPYEDAGVKRYISENENKPASFWNKFPDTPITIAAVYTAIWNIESPDYNESERLGIWGKDSAYTSLMLCNVSGYRDLGYTSYDYFVNLFTTYKTSTTISSINETNGGKIYLNNADNTRRIWGISSSIVPDDPTGGEGSIGGGTINDQSGGNGSFDDNGDDVGFSSGGSINSTNTITNWYVGQKNSSEVDTFLDLLGDWLKTTGDPDSDHPFQGLGYKYSDKLANLVSLKMIFSPSDPSISGPLIPHIHGQIVHGSGSEANPIAYKVTNQIKQDPIRLNFRIEEYFGSFLDYAPYTDVKIYLPFAGVHSLDPSDVIGKDLSLFASVDFVSGDIVYNIRINTGTSNSILYTFTGNAAVDLPITANDYSGKVSAGINTALSLAGVVGGIAGASVTGGASLGLSFGSLTSLIGNAASFASESYKSSIKGSIGGIAGALSPRQAYLIVTRPKKVEAEDYGTINGYPCMKSYRIGDLKGFIKTADCHWSIPGATEDEINEINELMKNEGAILT